MRVNASDRLFGLEVNVDDLADVEDDPETYGPPESAKTVVSYFYARSLVERTGGSIYDAWKVDVDEAGVVTRSEDFVLWREDIDMTTLRTKADVLASVKAFLAKAETALQRQ